MSRFLTQSYVHILILKNLKFISVEVTCYINAHSDILAVF